MTDKEEFLLLNRNQIQFKEDIKSFTVTTAPPQTVIDSPAPLQNQIVVFQNGNTTGGGKGYSFKQKAFTLNANDKQAVMTSENLYIRKLTPRECERLQGFPDDYTKIPYHGKEADKCPNGPRYKAIGNSWPVPVIRWLGERIEKVIKEIECEKDKNENR